MTVHEGDLYAAISAGIWRLSEGRWSDITAPLIVHAKAGPYAFASTSLGLGVSFWGEPGVALYEEAGWRRLPNPTGGWGAGVRTVYCLAEFRGQIYVGTGTGKLSGLGSSVYRYDGQTWEKVGGGGVRGSWTAQGIPFVLSLRVFGNSLIATLSRPHHTSAAASNVWAFDGAEWRPIGVGRTPDLMGRSLIMNDALVYRRTLVVATGDSHMRRPRVWALDHEQRWHDTSGDALSDSSNTRPGGLWIYSLATDNVSLYAGTAGYQGSAKVFRFAPDQHI
jgi:hypothetical protein